MKNGVHTIVDNTEKVLAGIDMLATTRVLVGVPGDKSHRDGTSEIGNAALAYIHDNGAPEAGIPARPFMEPGIASMGDELNQRLENIGKAALDGRTEAADKGFHALGLRASAAIKNRINEGVPPPLAESTLRKRAARGRTGAQKELDRRRKGMGASTRFAKPLIDTGQLRNAITYVLRKVGL